MHTAMFFGPQGWVELMERETGGFSFPPDFVAVCLNPDKQFRNRIGILQQLVAEGKRVFLTSTLRERELRGNPQLSNILDSPQVDFTQAPERRLLQHLRQNFDPR